MASFEKFLGKDADDWTGERCWLLVESRLEDAYLDTIIELAKIIGGLQRGDKYYGDPVMARLRKRVIQGAYAHDFDYWRNASRHSEFILQRDVEEELLDAIVYKAIRRWIMDEQAFAAAGMTTGTDE
jgi:hypothetical protein